ncbi:MAG: YidC/Oxa1 family membrane protein insertase [Candidatus Roizmanbacteria bacterium]|nr:YidC/Oxa1 family membrane protein insertase [Candidatus Roizmanbacteria bacterium]
MMQPLLSFYNTVFVNPIVNLLALYHYLLVLAKVPGALGFSIVALTVTIRLLLHPFFKQQMDSAKKMQDIKPHIDNLSKKHKGDAKKMQEEQMRLYQEAGINPASGCLFMIIQIPVFLALYQTLQHFFVADTSKIILSLNKILYFPLLHFKTLDVWFLGLNLAATPQQMKSVFAYLIPIVTAILQYFQTVSTTAGMIQPQAEPTKTKDGKKDDKSTGDDFQKAMNTQMKYVFPLMIGWFALRMPIGLALYWNIFSIFSIIQYELHKRQSKTVGNANVKALQK